MRVSWLMSEQKVESQDSENRIFKWMFGLDNHVNRVLPYRSLRWSWNWSGPIYRAIPNPVPDLLQRPFSARTPGLVLNMFTFALFEPYPCQSQHVGFSMVEFHSG